MTRHEPLWPDLSADKRTRRRGVLRALVTQWRWMAVMAALVGVGWGARSGLAAIVTRDAMSEHERSVHPRTEEQITEIRVQLAELRGQQVAILEQLRWLGPEIKAIGLRLGTGPEEPPTIGDVNETQEDRK